MKDILTPEFHAMVYVVNESTRSTCFHSSRRCYCSHNSCAVDIELFNAAMKINKIYQDFDQLKQGSSDKSTFLNGIENIRKEAEEVLIKMRNMHVMSSSLKLDCDVRRVCVKQYLSILNEVKSIEVICNNEKAEAEREMD